MAGEAQLDLHQTSCWCFCYYICYKHTYALLLAFASEAATGACVAGEAQLDVQDGSFRQEPGSGVCGQVQGASIAVGNLDWVRSHSQPSTSSPTSSSVTVPSSHINSSLSSSHTKHASGSDGASDYNRQSHSPSSSDGSSANNASSSSSRNGAQAASSHANDGQQRGAGTEQASTSGRSDLVDTGLMTVYVGVNGSLAGVFEIRDQLRPDAAATIRGLQQQGIDTILLSGMIAPNGTIMCKCCRSNDLSVLFCDAPCRCGHSVGQAAAAVLCCVMLLLGQAVRMVDGAMAVKQAVSRHEDGYVAVGRPVLASRGQA